MRFRKLSLHLILTVAFGMVLSACGIHPVAAQAISFTGSLLPKPAGVALDSLNIADLNAALGAYLRENRDVLLAETLLDVPFEDKFEVWDDVKDEIPLPKVSMTNIVQPGLDKTDWNPTPNAIAFGARILKVRDLKVDLTLNPQVLEKTWLGYKNKKGSGGEKQFQMPFEEFIMRYIIAKAKEDIHLNAIYHGVYNAAGNTPADTMDGILKVIVDEIAALSMTPIVTGAITSANVKDKLLLVYDGLDEAVKHKPTQMIVNSGIFDWYVRLHDPIANAYLVRQDVQGLADTPMLNYFPLFGTNCTIKREPGLKTSQRVLVTPKENMVYGVDSLDDSGEIMIEKEKRTLNLMMDFKAGVQIKQVDDKIIRVNDQA